jgi:predicted RNA-binding protein YlqC (UPF0109 family)
MSELLRNYVEETTKKLVDNPDDVQVNVAVSTKTFIINIRTSKRDRGKVIGKAGRTVESLKIITLAIKNTNFPDDTRRVSLEILEDEISNFSYNRNKEE